MSLRPVISTARFPKFSKSFWIAFPCRIKMARLSHAEPAPSSDGAEQSQEGQAESGEAPEGAEQEGSVESAAQQE